MGDKLKRYVEAQRDDLELYSFDVNKGWQEIEEQVQAPHEKRVLRPWMMVAASVGLLLVGTLIGFRMYSTTQVAQGSSEFVDMQFYYEEMVASKLQLVQSQVEDPEIIADLEAMDQAFAELKADLEDDVDNEEVLEAMIDNYRLKLQILQRILDELEEESHEQETDI